MLTSNSLSKESKENEEIINNSNKYDINNFNMKSSEFNRTDNNFDNKNLTTSIMYINSNIDKNIHIKNGNENYGNNIYNNSCSNENNLNFGDLEIDQPNSDQDFIDNLEIIKVSLASQKISLNSQKIEYKKDDTDIINNNEENEYENKNNDKFYKPLDKYENKFNLDQINPF